MIEIGKPFKTLVVALSTLIALSACSISLNRSYPEKRYYLLEARREKAEQPASAAILEVRKLRATPPYADKGFIYRRGEASYETDFYNELFIEPDELLTGCTRQWFTDAGAFAHVVDPGSHLEATHILEGALVKMYGDHSGIRPHAVLELQFLLIEDSLASPKVVLQRSYAERVQLSLATPEALVQGWNEALKKILTRFEADLKNIPLATEINKIQTNSHSK